MKVNNIKLTDYRSHGDLLELVGLDSATLEEVTSMDTRVVEIRTDNGDLVEAFAGFLLASVTYDVGSGRFRAVLARASEDRTTAVLDALAARMAAQESAQEDTMLALAELAGIMTAGEPAEKVVE